MAKQLSTWKCKACGGTYSDTQPDGLTYYHACAPLPPNAQGVQVDPPNKRDENIGRDAKQRVTGLRAEGAGVAPVGQTALTEPAWVTTLKTAVAKAQAD